MKPGDDEVLEATFSFIDIAGFTALTEAHGDVGAADSADRFVALVREGLGAGDRLVKTIGDAVLLTSLDPPAAIGALQRIVTAAGHEHDFPLLRAGLHHGTAVVRNRDVFGAAVNLAARVAAHAGGGQVLATSEVAEAARAGGARVESLGAVALHNLPAPVELFALHLVPDARSTVMDPVCRMRVQENRAVGRLSYGGRTYWFCSLECAARFAAKPSQYVREDGS